MAKESLRCLPTGKVKIFNPEDLVIAPPTPEHCLRGKHKTLIAYAWLPRALYQTHFGGHEAFIDGNPSFLNKAFIAKDYLFVVEF